MTNHFIITLFACLLLFSSRTFSVTDTLSFLGVEESPDTLVSKKVEKDSISENTPKVFNVTKMLQDSIALDSVQRGMRRDSLLSRDVKKRKLYQRHPQSLDSIYNAYQSFPFQVFQTDGANLYDVLFSHPLYTSVPVALSSNLNRFLFYGLPADHISLRPRNNLFNFNTNPTVGPNFYSASEMKRLFFNSPGEILLDLFPSKMTRSETLIQIELGVFNESILDLRFARPLSKSVQLGIFSNFQYFNRQDYSHSAGDLYNFFRDTYAFLGLDTTNVSHTGRNPLTREHIAAACLDWNPGGTAAVRLTYRYADLHNDIVSEVLDSLTFEPSLLWEERSHYNHMVNTNLTSIPLIGHLRFNGEAILQSSVNRMDPINKGESEVRRGEKLRYAGAVMPYVPFSTFNGNDTLSVQFRTVRDELIRYSGSRWVTHNTQATLNYVNNFTINSYRGSLRGKGGYAFVKVNGELEYHPLLKLSLINTLADQEFRVFAMQDVLPPTIPFDKLQFLFIPGELLNDYQSFGAELQLRYKKGGLLLGSCLINNVWRSSVEKVWPLGIPPYYEPDWVLTVAPSFGRWYGLSGISQWVFSEKKPFVKSKSVVSYHINRKGKALNVMVDLGFEYWSGRDSVNYGGIDMWHRPIYDLHLKTTAQIKNFRLFYKIDNIFNRKISYLRGYYMPGLVFRWGFNWLIQG